LNFPNPFTSVEYSVKRGAQKMKISNPIIKGVALSGFLSLAPFTMAQAELLQLEDTGLSSVYAQAGKPTDAQLAAATDLGEAIFIIASPISQSIGLNLNITLEGGITGALFGINGNLGTGFIGQALNSIEKSFK
jgi:hypothetical protein